MCSRRRRRAAAAAQAEQAAAQAAAAAPTSSAADPTYAPAKTATAAAPQLQASVAAGAAGVGDMFGFTADERARRKQKGLTVGGRTLLTGPAGVDRSMFSLGRSTLLGQ